MLQERVGSQLQNEAVSVRSEGKGEKQVVDAYLKKWRLQPLPPDLEFGWVRVGQKEGKGAVFRGC